MNKNTTVYEIKTSSFEEENFFILTDLTPSQIKKVITPLIEKEREEEDLIDNETLVARLQERYPKKTVIFYQSFDLIEF